jgi:hypothetical protein
VGYRSTSKSVAILYVDKKNTNLTYNTIKAGTWQLMPVILATWKSEIERITRLTWDYKKKKKVGETPSQPIIGHSDTCLSSKHMGG